MGFKKENIIDYFDGIYGEKLFFENSINGYLFSCKELGIKNKFVNSEERKKLLDKYVHNGFYEYNDDLENKMNRLINMNEYICFMSEVFLRDNDYDSLKGFINYKWDISNIFNVEYDNKIKWLLLGNRNIDDIFNDKKLNSKYIKFVNDIYNINLLDY